MARTRLLAAVAALAAPLAALARNASEPPRTWVDPDTGHRVVRLTTEPGSASLYFNRNSYTTPEGIWALDLETRAARPVVKDRVGIMAVAKTEEQ